MSDLDMGHFLGELRTLIEKWQTPGSTEQRVQALGLTVAHLSGVVAVLTSRIEGLDRIVTALMTSRRDDG